LEAAAARTLSSVVRLRRPWIAISVWYALAACGSPPLPEDDDGEPYLIGSLTSINHHATGTGFLVRAGRPSDDPCGILATGDAQTRYRSRSGASLQEIPLSELILGDTVEVYVVGPVAESCPLQGRASMIVRVGRGF
jgi:hypothetical protein